MPKVTASFAERSAAIMACQDLREAYPDLSVAVQVSMKSEGDEGEEGFLSALRSLMVEIVGAQHPVGPEGAAGDPAKLIVSGVDTLQLEDVEMLLSKHRPMLINESTERAGHDGA